MADADAAEVEQPGPEAEDVFGDRLPLVRRYARWLAEDGTERGLLGPRERPRLWTRHLLNSAVLTDLIPSGARVADVGSGAGLPGMVVALRRPDLRVTLVEPLLRRSRFLTEVVEDLGLDESVDVVRARAEELHGRMAFDVVTARAVAPLERLAAWCLPLVVPRGSLLALKGSSAEEELATARPALEQWDVRDLEVVRLGSDPEPTWVVRVQVGDTPVGDAQGPGPARRRHGGAVRPGRRAAKSTTQSNRSGR